MLRNTLTIYITIIYVTILNEVLSLNAQECAMNGSKMSGLATPQ